MRILLVQALTSLDMELVYPLGLTCLAAHLDGHEVEIFDVNLHRDRPEVLADKLREINPQVVGVSLRNIKVFRPGGMEDDFNPQVAIIRRIRQVLPRVFLVVGGTAFSLYARPLMQMLPEVDVGVWGEGELRFAELLRTRAPASIPGVYYREDGEVRYSGAPPPLDFDSLRAPRRELVDHQPYLVSSPVSVGIQAKRGCVLDCIHCSDTFLLGRKVRLRSPVSVADELTELVENHGVNRVFFCDQIFNIPPEHAIEICQHIAERNLGLRWSAWFNENRRTLSDELMVWLKRAGCDLLSFSPDHVDDAVLRKLGKNFTSRDLAYTLDLAQRFDIDVEYSFFLNSPGENAISLVRLFSFLLRARLQLGDRLRLFTLLMMQPIRIYPHTKLAELARELGLVDVGDDLLEARFYNPPPLSALVAGVQGAARVAYGIRRLYR
ncbi:MAG: radical SAM protein [Proteobacteria bacterium]|jgi:anaerobic magnesium-protoporphyrin IX monomethyl ester cyclase|nr:radical SAM protein [Pseudomonadota bacterium]